MTGNVSLFLPRMHCDTSENTLSSIYWGGLWPGLRHCLVHKQVDGLLRGHLNAFSDDPHELGHCYVRGDQVLPLVNLHDLWSWHLLHNDLTYNNNRIHWFYIDSIYFHAVMTMSNPWSDEVSWCHSLEPYQGTCCGFWLTLCTDVLMVKRKWISN